MSAVHKKEVQRCCIYSAEPGHDGQCPRPVWCRGRCRVHYVALMASIRDLSAEEKDAAAERDRELNQPPAKKWEYENIEGEAELAAKQEE